METEKEEKIFVSFAVFAGRPALSFTDEWESDPEPTAVSQQALHLAPYVSWLF